jgi:DNA-binding transcriptional regulator GbsR (MarR family)
MFQFVLKLREIRPVIFYDGRRPEDSPMTAGPHIEPESLPSRGSTASDDPSADLHAAQQRFVSLWSRMASTWGISRTMAEVHAWLFIRGGARHAEEVMEALEISRGNASMTLRRLEEWELVTRVHRRGDRKEYFEAEQDVWRMFRTILSQRKKRELDPLLEDLDGCRATDASAPDEEAARVHDQRIDDMASFLGLVDTVAERILAEDIDGGFTHDLLGRVRSAVAAPASAEPGTDRGESRR